MSRKKAQKDQFIVPIEWLTHLDYALIADTIVEGLMSGLHRGIYHGFGIEFIQYRPYAPGDDLRFIDWRVFARCGELRTKMYQEESNCVTCILLDQSASMAYAHPPRLSKMEYAKILAAALINLAYRQTDQIGLYSYNDTLRVHMAPSRARDWRQRLYLELKRIHPYGESIPHKLGLYLLEHLIRRGIIVVISDFLDPHLQIFKELRLLKSAHHEIILIQVLDDDELFLPFDHSCRFCDAETRQELTTYPPRVRQEYERRFRAFLNQLRREACAYEMDYLLLRTGMDPVVGLRSWLHRRLTYR